MKFSGIIPVVISLLSTPFESHANANLFFEDEVNVVEGDMCRSSQVLAVHVGSPARITVKLQGKDPLGVPSGPLTTIVENELSAIGVSKILMGNTDFADGNYEMTISAQSVANTARVDRVVGTVTRRTKRLDLRSLAHSEVQGVDLFSGGFSTVETDVPHIGRGPELALNRSYSSHAGDQLGAFGRGIDTVLFHADSSDIRMSRPHKMES